MYIAVSFELPMEMIDNGNLIGSINGAVIGGARLVSGKIGLALYTNGVDQCVDFGYQGDTCLGSISLCVHGWVTAFWMQPADENPGVIMDTGVYGYDRVWIFVNSLGFLKARFQKSYPYTFWELFIEFSSQQVWNHLVITWQLSCGAKLYINGQLVHASTTSDKSPSNGIPRFVLGANNKCQNWYKAALDEFRFWDTVMSDEEVLALYTVDAGLNWELTGIFCYSTKAKYDGSTNRNFTECLQILCWQCILMWMRSCSNTFSIKLAMHFDHY